MKENHKRKGERNTREKTQKRKNTRKDFMYVILRLHLKDLHTMAQNRSFYYSSLR